VAALCTATATALAIGSTPARGQEQPDTNVRGAPSGSQFLIPMSSFLLPGLGQYLHGAPLTGAAYTSASLLGATLYNARGPGVGDDLPRDARGQEGYTGLLVVAGAAYLGTYDAFRRAVPRLQQEGKYAFLTNHAPVSSLWTAPFDMRFLRRWTTWVDLAYTGAVTAIVLSRRDPGRVYEPFTAHDAAFVTALSLNAGIGEEAVFRGWLYPVLHQQLRQRWWLSDGIQASIFGGLHTATAQAFAIVIGAHAFYEGWLTRHNGWNVRESVFHHFWYDMAIGIAEFLTDERATVTLAFPAVAF